MSALSVPLFLLLNASLNRLVSLRAQTAGMPATLATLILLLCPPVLDPTFAFLLYKASLWLLFQYHVCSVESCCDLPFKLICTLLLKLFVLCAWDLMMCSFLFPSSSCFFPNLSCLLSLLLPPLHPLPCLVRFSHCLSQGKVPVNMDAEAVP